MTTYFTSATFRFLTELRANNNRDWFLANRARYETDVREPALRFINDVGPGLKKVSPHLIADPRPVGGSLFRVNRDVRFSADKSPYKTALAMSFRHDATKAGPSAAPGLYLHLEPGSTWAGGGVHMPETATLGRIRDAIVAHPGDWKKATTSKADPGMFVNNHAALKRAPQGYDPNHPLVEDLKRKEFTWHAMFTQAEVCRPDFMERYLAACRASVPFMRFLAGAVGAAW